MASSQNLSLRPSTNFPPAESSSGITRKDTKEEENQTPTEGGRPSSDSQRRAAETQRQNMFFESMRPVEFAKQKIENARGPADLHDFFETLEHLFSDDEKLEIAKIRPKLTEEYSHRFVFNERSKKIRFAAFLIGESPFTVAKIRKTLEINEQKDLIEIGDQVADNQPIYIAVFLKDIPIEDENRRFDWACKMAQANPTLFNYQMHHFRLTESHQRTAIFIAANNVSFKSGTEFEDSDFFTQADRLELLLILAERAPDACIHNLRNFPSLEKNDRLTLARKVAEKYVEGLFRDIDQFALDKGEVHDLYLTHFSRFVASCTDEVLKISARLGRINEEAIEKSIAESIYRCTENLFGEEAEIPGFRKHADQLDIKLPCIAEFLDESRAVSNPKPREVLGTWAHYARLRFSRADIPQAAKGHLTSTLQGIFQYHRPETRYPLTDLVSEITNPKPKDKFLAQRFSEISSALTKPHTWVFRPLLCALAPDAPSAENLLFKYAALLARDEFKDKNLQRNIVDGFLALIQAPHIADKEKQRLLNVLTPGMQNENDIEMFSQAMRNLAEFIPYTAMEKTREKAMKELMEIEKNGDFPMAFGRVFLEIHKSNEKAT